MASKKREVWEWAFETSGQNPLAWRASAQDLLAGANAIKEKVRDFGPMMDSLAVVEAMLLGFGLECLLKAMWIKGNNSLTESGRLRGIPRVGDHELLKIARAVRYRLSHEEAAVLNKLTAFVKFAGRYPIATRAEQMKPTRRLGTSVLEHPRFIGRSDLEIGRRLAHRLMNDAQPWVK